jgi:hypothetical protein
MKDKVKKVRKRSNDGLLIVFASFCAFWVAYCFVALSRFDSIFDLMDDGDEDTPQFAGLGTKRGEFSLGENSRALEEFEPVCGFFLFRSAASILGMKSGSDLAN